MLHIQGAAVLDQISIHEYSLTLMTYGNIWHTYFWTRVYLSFKVWNLNIQHTLFIHGIIYEIYCMHLYQRVKTKGYQVLLNIEADRTSNFKTFKMH